MMKLYLMLFSFNEFMQLISVVKTQHILPLRNQYAV